MCVDSSFNWEKFPPCVSKKDYQDIAVTAVGNHNIVIIMI